MEGERGDGEREELREERRGRGEREGEERGRERREGGRGGREGERERELLCLYHTLKELCACSFLATPPQNRQPYLDLLSRYMEVHATVGTTRQTGRSAAKEMGASIPGFVLNHGILNGSALHDLLKETKVFVGLGFPYEGPAPLEAISYGCYFLNPKLIPPLSRRNSDFFKTKPTNRAVSHCVCKGLKLEQNC